MKPNASIASYIIPNLIPCFKHRVLNRVHATSSLEGRISKFNLDQDNDNQAMDIKLTPHLSKMPTDGETINKIKSGFDRKRIAGG
jgi:hypothetical protein